MHFWRKQKPSYERAMDWFKANMVPGQGIIVHTKQPAPYPEVTGYFIPTLYNWDDKELARPGIPWLMSIQLPDGMRNKTVPKSASHESRRQTCRGN